MTTHAAITVMIGAAGMALAVVACDRSGDPSQGAPSGQPDRLGQTAGRASQAPAGGHRHDGHGQAHGEAPASSVSGAVATVSDPATGKPMQVLGARLTGVPVAKVTALTAHPADYVGKTVRVEGNVLGMCEHRRAWFAVQDEGDRTSGFVRIVTAPKFLVPAGSVGKKARVEGTVEIVEVSAQQARYFAKSHHMGDPGQITGPVKRPILRATGAELL